jgi:hypothetical protein
MENEKTILAVGVPVAPNVVASSPEAKAQDVAMKIRLASEMGRIHAMHEKEKIQRIHEDVQEKPIVESQRVAVADEIAKQRVKEGLEVSVKGDVIYGDKESSLLEVPKKMESNDENDMEMKNDKKGYQISEYDFKEYSCLNHKTTQEYKSRYD